jgi:hypothetical protein
VDQEGAREHELADLEAVAQSAQQAAGALDRDAVVFGVWLARQIIIGREVDRRGDPRPELASHLGEGIAHVPVGGQVDLDRLREMLVLALGDIEADDGEPSGQPGRKRSPDEAAAPGDQDHIGSVAGLVHAARSVASPYSAPPDLPGFPAPSRPFRAAVPIKVGRHKLGTASCPGNWVGPQPRASCPAI